MYCVEPSGTYKLTHSGDRIKEPVWHSFDMPMWNPTPYIADFLPTPPLVKNFRNQAIHRFDLLKPGFALSRSDEAHEQFFNVDVKAFLLEYGAFAIRLLDMHCSNHGDVSPEAKYHFACLLGHITDPTTKQLRLEYLNNYVNSADEALHAGARDALDFLDLV